MTHLFRPNINHEESTILVFGMRTLWKGREVSVADVFHVLVYARRGSIVAVDSH
jgi:hypothetical protein